MSISSILDYVNFVQTVNFNVIYKIVIICLGLIWLAVIIWLSKDASRRYKHQIWIIPLCLIILPFNFIGLIIYLLIRPSIITDEGRWLDLERKYLLYEVDGVEFCSCGELLKPTYLLCPNCTRALRTHCIHCNNIIELDWVKCPYCVEDTEFKPMNDVELKKPNIILSLVDYLGRSMVGGIKKMGVVIQQVRYSIVRISTTVELTIKSEMKQGQERIRKYESSILPHTAKDVEGSNEMQTSKPQVVAYKLEKKSRKQKKYTKGKKSTSGKVKKNVKRNHT